MVHKIGEDNVLWQVKERRTAAGAVKMGDGGACFRKALQMPISLSLFNGTRNHHLMSGLNWKLCPGQFQCRVSRETLKYLMISSSSSHSRRTAMSHRDGSRAGEHLP